MAEVRKRQILSEFDRVVHERTDAQKQALRFEYLARELYEALRFEVEPYTASSVAPRTREVLAEYEKLVDMKG